jgi:hypothetical protein
VFDGQGGVWSQKRIAVFGRFDRDTTRVVVAVLPGLCVSARADRRRGRLLDRDRASQHVGRH